MLIINKRDAAVKRELFDIKRKIKKDEVWNGDSCGVGLAQCESNPKITDMSSGVANPKEDPLSRPG